MKRSYFTTLGMLGAFLLLLAWYFLYEKKYKGEFTRKEDVAKQFVTLSKDQIKELIIERQKNPPSEDAETTPEVSANAPAAQYDRIQLKRSGENWNLVAPVEDQADSSAVASLITTLTTTKQDRLVLDNPTDLALFGLKDPIVKVTIAGDTAGANTTETLLIGRKTPVGFGVYVKLASKSSVYKASQSFRSALEKQPKELRSKTIFNWVRSDIGEIEVSGKVSLILKKGEKESWTLARENLPADVNETNKILNSIIDMRATDFVSEDGKNLAGFGLEPPQLRTVLTSLKDKSRQVLSFGQMSGKTYVRKDDKPVVFEISSDTWTKLTQPPEKYRNLEVASFNRFDIKRIKIEREKEPLEFFKESSDWILPLDPNVKIDSAKVDTLLTKLQDMRLVRYAPMAKSPQKPQIVVRLFEKKDSNEVEKLSLRFGAAKGAEVAVEREGLGIPFFIKSEDLKPLLQTRSDYIKPEPPPPKTDLKGEPKAEPPKTEKSTG